VDKGEAKIGARGTNHLRIPLATKVHKLGEDEGEARIGAWEEITESVLFGKKEIVKKAKIARMSTNRNFIHVEF
jgi:hypothetical protein